MSNLNEIMDAVGIPVFTVDETGAQPTNKKAREHMRGEHSQEVLRVISMDNDRIAIIYEAKHKTQPYRVELNNNGQGVYFETLGKAEKFASESVYGKGE